MRRNRERDERGTNGPLAARSGANGPAANKRELMVDPVCRSPHERKIRLASNVEFRTLRRTREVAIRIGYRDFHLVLFTSTVVADGSRCA